MFIEVLLSFCHAGSYLEVLVTHYESLCLNRIVTTQQYEPRVRKPSNVRKIQHWKRNNNNGKTDLTRKSKILKI